MSDGVGSNRAMLTSDADDWPRQHVSTIPLRATTLYSAVWTTTWDHSTLFFYNAGVVQEVHHIGSQK